VTLRPALLVSEMVTTGIEPRRRLSDPECRAERLGFALGGLAAELGGDRSGAKTVARRRLSATTARRVVTAAIVPLVALIVWQALVSEELARPVASALYWSYLTAVPMATGLYWWMRRPASRLGPLLVAFGILAWMVSWKSSALPLLSNIAVLVEAPYIAMPFYLLLAFPRCRLERAAARWLMGVLALAVGAVFVPWALVSSVSVDGGPAKAEGYTALAITVAVLVVYVLQLRTASRHRRRALMAVAVTSLLLVLASFAFIVSASIPNVAPATLDTLAWGVVGARFLVPLGFLIALLQAERFAAGALRELV
jgi:hypothetical protein